MKVTITNKDHRVFDLMKHEYVHEVAVLKEHLSWFIGEVQIRFPERGFHIDAPADSDKATIKKL